MRSNLSVFSVGSLTAAAVLAGLGPVTRGAQISYQNLVNQDNPLVYLMMDEAGGTTATNSASGTKSLGSAANGTYGSSTNVSPGAPSANGILNTAVSSTGGVTTVKIPTNPAFDAIGTGNFTFEMWFNTDTVATRQDLFTFKRNSTGSDMGLQIDNVNYPGELALYHTSGFPVHSAAISANTWYFVAVVRSGGTDTLYLNGQAVSTGSDSASVTTDSAPILLGSNTSNASPFMGTMDEFAFYNTAVPASTLLAEYNAVPEPASLGLLGGAAVALLARRRRTA